MKFDYKIAFYALVTACVIVYFLYGISQMIEESNLQGYNQGVTDNQNQTYNYLLEVYPTCTPVSIPYIYENQSVNLNFYSEYCIKQGSNGQ